MRSRRTIYITSGSAVLIAIVIAPWVYNAFSLTTSTLGSRLSFVAIGVRSWWNFPSLERTNQGLQDSLFKALTGQARMHALDEENAQLRSLVALTQRTPNSIKTALVVARSPVLLGRLLTVDAGKKDGVGVGQAVLSSEGALIGTISDTEDYRSTVLLVTDPLSKIAGISSQTDVEGIVSGTTGSSLSFDFVPSSAPISKDETIITSGIDERIPPGLAIGQVRSITTDSQGLLLKIDALPAFDRLRLNFVAIITNR